MPYGRPLPTGWPKGYVNSKGQSIEFSRPWPRSEVCRKSSDIKYFIPPPGVPVALDTEMVELRFYNGHRPMEPGNGREYKTKGAGIKIAGSVAIIDLMGRKCYEAFVRPEFEPVTYNQRISGLSRHLLKNAVHFRDMQAQVCQILAHRDVIGSAVAGDIDALLLRSVAGMNLIELQSSSHVVNALNAANCSGRKLSDMSRIIAKKEIQTGSGPHNAAEDALAAVQVARVIVPEYKNMYDSYAESAYNQGLRMNDGEFPTMETFLL